MTARLDPLPPHPRDTPSSLPELLGSTNAAADRRLWTWALALAALLHVGLFAVSLPDRKTEPLRIASRPDPLTIRKTTLPPPPTPRTRPQGRRPTPEPRPLLTDPSPDLEPVIEPAAEWESDSLAPVDFEYPIDPGPISAPPTEAEPLIAGSPGVSLPVLQPDTKVLPDYPPLARAARREGNVILQAVILEDGTVGDLTVLQVDPPGFEFEQRAMEAVRRWQYEPALQGGRPVQVYFTVVVTFRLR